jgi:hypothetical protein
MSNRLVKMIKDVYDKVWHCYTHGEVYPLQTNDGEFNWIMFRCHYLNDKSVNRRFHEICQSMYYGWRHNLNYDENTCYDQEEILKEIVTVLRDPKTCYLPTFTWLSQNRANDNIGAVMHKGSFKPALTGNMKIVQRVFPSARITKAKSSFRISLPSEHLGEFQEIFGDIHYHHTHTKAIQKMIDACLLPELAPICIEYL